MIERSVIERSVIERFEELMGTVRVLPVPASSAWMAEVPAFGWKLWAIAPEAEDAELALRQVVWRWLGLRPALLGPRVRLPRRP